MTPTNEERADWAEEAVDVFAQTTMFRPFRELFDAEDEGDGPDAIADLIGNLMHLAHQLGWDAEKLCERGKGHFEFERDNACAKCGQTDGCNCDDDDDDEEADCENEACAAGHFVKKADLNDEGLCPAHAEDPIEKAVADLKAAGLVEEEGGLLKPTEAGKAYPDSETPL